jgi:hypothetical protein
VIDSAHKPGNGTNIITLIGIAALFPLTAVIWY